MGGAATVEKALDLLFHLHEMGAPLGPSEIGRNLRLPRSSCHRLLRSLADRGVVERDDRGRYRPGAALLALGLAVQQREPVVRAARPVLEEEATTLGETVFLVARRRGLLQVLDKSEGSGLLRFAPDVGDSIPEDVTAVGKLYRSFGSDRALPSARPADLVGPTSYPSDEASTIRRLGYATNRDAWIDGLSVLAVPIWPGGPRHPDEPAEPVAAIALGAASSRFDALGEALVADRIRRAAIRVGERLSGARLSRGPDPVDPRSVRE